MSIFHTNKIMHPRDLLLKVKDIKRSRDFYESVIGFKVLKENNKEVVFTANGKSPILTIVEPENVIEKIPRRTGLYHFAILLPNRFQLGLFLKNIRRVGYPIRGGSNHGVSEAIYLEDPDDNGIEVYSDTNIDTWIWEKEKIRMTSLPIDYDSLLSGTGDREWEGIPGGAIIGHIHLHIADLEEAKKFYVDGLGFDLVMDMNKSALFISAGGYHHHLGLNIWNGRGAKPLPGNSVGMKYFTLNFPSKEDLEKKLEKLRELGYESVRQDGDIFIKDPSENFIKVSVK